MVKGTLQPLGENALITHAGSSCGIAGVRLSSYPDFRYFDMHNSIVSFLFGPKYQKTRFYAAFILYALIVIVGSLPHAREDIGQLASGLVLHSLAYSVITFLLFTGGQGSQVGKAIRAFLIVMVMGVLDEFVQSFFPYRTAAVGDWLVDCTASFVTALLLVTSYSLWPVQDSRVSPK